MNKIKLSTFNLYDEHSWTKEAVLEAAKDCASRRADILGWADVEVKEAEENFSSKNGKYTVYRFDVYGVGTPELEELPEEKQPEDTALEPFAPWKDAPDGNKQITVKMLTEMLLSLPTEYDDFEVKYDSACGHIDKRDFTIYPDSKKISING